MAKQGKNPAVAKPKQWQSAPMKQTFRPQEATPKKGGNQCKTCGK